MVHPSKIDSKIPKLSLPKGAPYHVTRAVATLLNYPRGTALRNNSNRPWPESEYPVTEIYSPSSSPSYLFPDIILEFCNSREAIVTKFMKGDSPEQYALLETLFDGFSENVEKAMAQARSKSPRFYGSADFFDDRVSPKSSRMDQWEYRTIEPVF